MNSRGVNPINMWMQHTDEGQVSIPLPKIEPIADDEHVRNFETDIVGLDGRHPPSRLIEQDAGLDCSGFERR